jgi:hypothetical protein
MLLLLLGFDSGSVPRRVVSFFFVVDFANDSLLAKKQLSSRHCFFFLRGVDPFPNL